MLWAPVGRAAVGRHAADAPMITCIAIAVWLFVALVVTRLLRARVNQPGATRQGGRWLALLLILGVPLLFRPHELLQSGQDPGVYLNAAGAFHRHQSVFHVDPLLAEVPPSLRNYFLFGHAGYGLTKDSCLEIKDLDTARIGPRFPPLYPILMSPLIARGTPPLALYVAPLFALLTALALFVLLERLCRQSWAGGLAALFYLGAPLLIWHARAPRAELVAGFFCLAGFTLLLHAWEGEPWRRWPDLLIGAACVTLAPFIHITGWFMAVATASLIFCWLATGRADALLYPPLAALGLALFSWQTLFIGDQYQLRRFVEPCVQNPLRVLLVLLVLLVVPLLAVAIGRRCRRLPEQAAAWIRPSLSRRHQVELALLVATAALALHVGRTPLDARVFRGYEYHYIYPTDMPLAVRLISMPIALLGLAGLLALLLSRRPGAESRTAWVLWMLPGAFLVGNMQDFFMTRYLTPYFIPLLAGSLAALLALLPARAGWPRIARPAAAALVLGLMLWQRLSMVTTTEYRGLAAFFDHVAAPIRAGNGILLAEYARHATALEHIGGVTLLSLDNETRRDYRPILQAWQTIMERHPDRPAFFVTPFSPPVDDRFTFEWVQTSTLDAERLTVGRYRLPGAARAAHLDLHLYRMTLAPPPAPALPAVRTFDDGNMGLARFGRARPASWAPDGVALAAGTPTTIALSRSASFQAGDRLLLFLYEDAPGAAPLLDTSGAPPPGLEAPGWQRLTNGWSVAAWMATQATTLQEWPVHTVRPALAVDAWHLAPHQALPLEIAARTRGPWRHDFIARSVNSPCAMLTPTGAGAAGACLAILMAPDPHYGGTRTAWQVVDGEADLGTRRVTGERWSWQVWPLPAATPAAPYDWLALRPTGPGVPPQDDVSVARLACMAVLDASSYTNRP